jgi:propanol-preferring alcohol dehydrogenase
MKMLVFNYPDSKVFVFARNEKERHFALELGAVWAGDIVDIPPGKMWMQSLTLHLPGNPSWKL